MFLVKASLYHIAVPERPIAVLQVPINQYDVIALTEYFSEYPFMDGDRLIIKKPVLMKLNELYGKDTKAYQVLNEVELNDLWRLELIVTRIDQE